MCWCSVASRAQLFATPWDCSSPDFSVRGIFKARILDWVAISSSRGSSQPRIEHASPALVGELFTTEPPGKPHQAEGEAGKFNFYLGSSVPMFFFQIVFLNIYKEKEIEFASF